VTAAWVPGGSALQRERSRATILLEGMMSGDQCQGCVHQETNGSRAMEIAETELSRRQ
jgi:hypothetical protein